MADADQSIHTRQTRIDAGSIPRAPRLGGSASSATSGVESHSVRDRGSQGLGASQVRGGQPGLERVASDESLGNTTIKSVGTRFIPPAPPLGTIHVGASVKGNASGGSSGASPVGIGGKTRVEMLFSAAQDTPDYEIERDNGVILPRDERGRKGTSDYKKNRAAATSSIELKFGVAKHYVSSLDGKPEEGDATKNRFIQEAYVANLAKSEDFNMRLIQYDMKYIFRMSNLKEGIDPTRFRHPKDLWEPGTKINIIDS